MISELIDLTEHRDFGNAITRGTVHIESRAFWDRVKEEMLKDTYGKFIWRVKNEKEPIQYDGVFPLGNKQQRQETLQMYYWGSTEAKHCDCCGKEIKKIPWNKDSGLCKICNINYRQKGSFPWL